MTVSVTLPARIAHHHLRLGARMMIKSTPSTCVPSIIASAVSPTTTSVRQRSLAGYRSQTENLRSPQGAASPVTSHPAADKSIGTSPRRFEAPFIRRTGRPEENRATRAPPQCRSPARTIDSRLLHIPPKALWGSTLTGGWGFHGECLHSFPPKLFSYKIPDVISQVYK